MAYFLRNLQTSQVNNSRILKIKNAKFSGNCFYINTSIYRDFQIGISVPLSNREYITSKRIHDWDIIENFRYNCSQVQLNSERRGELHEIKQSREKMEIDKQIM